MKDYLIYDLKLMIQKRTFRFAFFGMMFLCIGLPFFQLFQHWGEYEYALPSADTLYIANRDSEWWSYLSFIFPFLIVLPFGFSFMEEYKSGVLLYVQSRGERKSYYYAQMLTCFFGAAFVIFIPFMFNIIFNGILFPVNGNDAVMGYQKYDSNWCRWIMGDGYYLDTLFKGAIFKHLAVDYPQINNLVFAVWAAFCSGMLSSFFYGISLLVKRGSIWVLIISYLFFRLFSMLDKIWEKALIFGVYVNLELKEYLAGGYPGDGLVYPLYLLILIGLCGISCGIVKYRVKKDER